MKLFCCLTGLIFYIATSTAQTCNCPEQFTFLTQKMAANYAGYRDKVNATTQPEFDRHTADYRLKTAATTADTTCFRLLTEWALFFRDHHVQLSYQASPDNPEAIRQLGKTSAQRSRCTHPTRSTWPGFGGRHLGNGRRQLPRCPAASADGYAGLRRHRVARG